MLVCEHEFRVFVRMHVQLNIKRKIRKYVCYILKGMVNGMIKALTHEFRQMEGFLIISTDNYSKQLS